MINLLPPEIKQSYRYARRNRRQVFWIVTFLLAITGVVVITGVGLLVMGQSIEKNETEVAEIQTRLTSQDLTGTQKEVTTISNNLKLMMNVLSKEILFSKLLVQLGNITPPGVVLTSLSISQTADAIDITARSINYDGAAQLQANLADPNNKIFSKADTVNISCSSANTQGIASTYPCTVTLKALFANDNPYLFINSGKAAQ